MSARDKLRAKNEEKKHLLAAESGVMTSVVDEIVENLPKVSEETPAVAEDSKDSLTKEVDNPSVQDTAKPVSVKAVALETVARESRSHEKTISNPKGAGRPVSDVPKTVTSFSLCELSLRQLKEMSMDNHVGMNRIIEAAVNEYMKEHDPESLERLQNKWGYRINPSLKGDGYIKS